MYLLATLRSLVFLASLGLVSSQVLLNLGQQHSNLFPRAGSPSSVALQYLDGLDEYTSQVKIGTPGQPMTMAIEFTNANSFGTLMASANMTICMNTTDVDSLCSFGTCQ